jgi:hypothetical protein
MPPPGAAARAVSAYDISLFRLYFRLWGEEFVPNGSQFGERPVER